MVDEPLRTPARVTLLGTAAVARAVGGHLTLPLIVLVRGLPFLGLVLIRPTEATLAIGGAQASAGRLPWTLLFAAAVVGAVLADLLSYALGRTLGDAALTRFASHRHGHRFAGAIDRSRRGVERHGAIAVALARPTVVGHGVVPVLAGIGRLPVPRYLVASAAGATLWAAAWLGGGVAAAAALRAGERVAAALVAAALVASVAAGVAMVCHRRPACFGAAG